MAGPAEAIIQSQSEAFVWKRPGDKLIQTRRIEASQCGEKPSGSGLQVTVR